LLTLSVYVGTHYVSKIINIGSHSPSLETYHSSRMPQEKYSPKKAGSWEVRGVTSMRFPYWAIMFTTA
jgi:hypothetical protein